MLFGVLSSVRRRLYAMGWIKSTTVSAPVIVVGNISVGGTGKSPVIQALAREFIQLGWKPGVVARGYGGESQSSPLLLSHQSNPEQAGDEPVMHFQQLGIPVCVHPQRALAAQHLIRETDCTLVLSDDGLQHYGLNRDLEIVVFDAVAGIGNGWLLPAGPLREPISRLKSVDLVLIKHSDAADGARILRALSPVIQDARKIIRFNLEPQAFRQLTTGKEFALDYFTGSAVHAVAGIGQPAQFFEQLRALSAHVTEHRFNDHHRFSTEDVTFGDDHPIIVTAKDAVKLRELEGVADNEWVLPAFRENRCIPLMAGRCWRTWLKGHVNLAPVRLWSQPMMLRLLSAATRSESMLK
jgi:tetraacyldisaccharide 4'-kinase